MSPVTRLLHDRESENGTPKEIGKLRGSSRLQKKADNAHATERIYRDDDGFEDEENCVEHVEFVLLTGVLQTRCKAGLDDGGDTRIDAKSYSEAVSRSKGKRWKESVNEEL